MKPSPEKLRFCFIVVILLTAVLYLEFSPNASPQAYFVLALGGIPALLAGVYKLQKARK
ncbi:hypothetical protein I0P70_01180 [Pontibacter sp. FD36]|uniref:hypothetical protein n=1 Tax=Pontibacter sp. FD36 TaxID=2789860 RepID=UPI0018ABB26A|nr:hypothetical protein [Pontibacter sp. FD36]MBF8961842.1 hypothetical protein [Pontibacter sp. FD36]